MRFCHAVCIAICLSMIAVPALAVDARMFREPDVSATQIAFVYAGDIWVVPKSGGTAQRLSSPRGAEASPRFSADGQRIAFSASYEGNGDVYVINVAGGTPTRVTYHPGFDRLIDWIGDDVLFASGRQSGPFPGQFFRAPAAGGMPSKLPVPYGAFASLHEDGRQLAYTTKMVGTWKRYRGGRAPEIWLFDLETLESRNLTENAAGDQHPMWHGDTLYFLSDRGPQQRMNIWAVNPGGGEPRQVTHFKDFDISSPAIGPEDIVFEAGGRLYLLSLSDEKHREVEVDVVTDLAQLKPRRHDVSEQLRQAGVSPSGKRAVVQARGEIYTLPAKEGFIRQLTHSSGVAELFPAWSPDGQKIAFWSDRSGEYELVMRAADGSGEEETLTEMGPGYRYQPHWSPDSKKIAFIDHTLTFQILDVESRELTKVDRGQAWLPGGLPRLRMNWSSDSRWLAYHRVVDNQLEAVFLFDTKNGERHQVTSAYYSDSGPVFDPDGKYLYYRSNRSLNPVYSSLDATWVYPNATRILAIPLKKDTPSPLAPRNDDEESSGEDKKDGAKKDKSKKDKGKKGEDSQDGEDEESEEDAGVEIDLEGMEARAVVLPPAPGNYGNLAAVSGKLIFRRFPLAGSPDRKTPLFMYDLKEREEKEILGDVDAYEVTADGKKALVAANRSWSIVDLKPGAKMKDRLPTGDLTAVVDPREEWRQMFREVWRTYRDHFYDAELHGLDWDAVGERYGKLVDDAVTRWDLNFLIRELIGELNASHTFAGGGDVERPDDGPATGLLGVDWELADGAYRIRRILRGGPWDAEVRSPLAEPGVDVQEGDYLLAVNGQPVDASVNLHAAFEGLAGETVELTVNGSPSSEGARRLVVETMRRDGELRLSDWIEEQRRYVEKASDGRLGYIYVRNTTAGGGQTDLVRQFTSQTIKDGLIIDERWNGGGQLADRFVELLTRQRVGFLYFRHAGIANWPGGVHYGPKAMLINGWAGSGGDSFPWAFREMNAGPIIGERTWGGLIGPAFGFPLIDGGFFTAPPGRLYRTDGQWFAEGHGVEPDIAVVDDPTELAHGRDAQLDAAIAEVLRMLESGANDGSVPRPEFERRVVE